MHIEPGVVHGAKLALGIVTASGAAAYVAKLAVDSLRDGGIVSLGVRSLLATVFVLVFFEILPHFPVGISEVHFILGTTLLLLLGAAPAALGLASGLFLQGLLFAPSDLPMYLINVTTLLVPLFAIHGLSKKIIAPDTPYVDLRYGQALTLSVTYQGGVVAWVAFWAFWGQGINAQTMASVALFGASYAVVLLIEPIVDLGILSAAKRARALERSGLFTPRLFQALT